MYNGEKLWYNKDAKETVVLPLQIIANVVGFEGKANADHTLAVSDLLVLADECRTVLSSS